MATGKPSIVLCHGIWADGSCFSKLIPALQADGHEVMAAQYGLDTAEGDVATVKRTLGRVQQPYPRRTLLWRKRHHGRWNRRPRRRPSLYCCTRPRRGRDIAESASEIPRSRRFLPHRSGGVSGCCRTVSSASRATCLNRRRRSSGQLTLPRPRTCSHKSSMA